MKVNSSANGLELMIFHWNDQNIQQEINVTSILTEITFSVTVNDSKYSHYTIWFMIIFTSTSSGGIN